MKNTGNIIFSEPKFSTKPSAWIEHIPFAFFLTEKLKPGVFVELGTHYGGSYFAFCQAIKELNLNTKAFAVDLFTGDDHAGYYNQEVFNYVIGINDDHFSHFSNILKSSFDEANQLFENKSIDLLHIDGLHTYDAAKHDFELWLPKMSEKGVVIFHDTAVKERGFGVWKLMDEIKTKYPYFEFSHGYGLGILCTGSKVNPGFLEFVKMAGSDGFTQKLFENIGRKTWLEQKHLQHKDELETLNILMKEKQQIIDAKVSEIKKLKNELVQTLDLNKKESVKYARQLNIARLASESQAHEISSLKISLTLLTNSASWKLTAPLRHAKRRVKSSALFLLPKIKLIEKSELFDADYYLQHNQDVRDSKMNPARHYLLYGGFEGRNPSLIFNSSLYLEQNVDVKAMAINPLLHYIKHGRDEGRIAKPVGAKSACPGKIIPPDISVEQMKKGNNPLNINDDAADIQIIRESGLFDEIWYLDKYDDVKLSGIDPVEHYFRWGWQENRIPGPDFDAYFYLKTYADVRSLNINPLLHYIRFGKAEGRLARHFDIHVRDREKQSIQLPYSKNILFITPNAHRSVEGILLLDLMKWFYKHTAYNLFLLILNPGNDKSKVLQSYKTVSKVFIREEFEVGYSHHDLLAKIKKEAGKIDLIFGCTRFAAGVYPFLQIFDAPYLSSIHESEAPVPDDMSLEIDKNLKEFTTVFISNSENIQKDLILNYEIDPEKLQVVNHNIHFDEVACTEILNICRIAMHTRPMVSVIVPVYNHERFLKERLDSILNQSFRDYEIIILDDASTDQSFKVAKTFLWHPAVRIIRNDINTGSPFQQWHKGLKLAKGEFIWIAEGDDKAGQLFLESLLPAFNNPKVSISYCAFHQINDLGEIVTDYFSKYCGSNLGFPKERYEMEYIASGLDEIKNALAIRNTIPNVSAVLFREKAIGKINFDEVMQFRVAGDWFVYVSILKDSDVSYCEKPLNYYRMHEDSMLGVNIKSPRNTLPDYFKMHQFILKHFDISDKTFHLMIGGVKNGLRNKWPGLSDKEFENLYDEKILSGLFEQRKMKTKS